MTKKTITLRENAMDILEDRPLEVCLSFALVLFGIRALATGLSTAPGSVQTLPLWLASMYCILSGLGGLSVLFGMFYRWKVSWAYGVELLGCFVSSSAWGSYIIGLMLSPITGRSTLLILALTALAVGLLFRARRIKQTSRAQLIALRHASLEKGSP